MEIDIHHIAPYLGLVGLLLTQWRWAVGQREAKRKDELALTQWRTNVERDVQNLKAYTARIEGEGKAVDAEHKQLFADIRGDLAELKEGQIEIKADLKAHRASCEGKRN